MVEPAPRDASAGDARCVSRRRALCEAPPRWLAGAVAAAGSKACR